MVHTAGAVRLCTGLDETSPGYLSRCDGGSGRGHSAGSVRLLRAPAPASTSQGLQ